MPVVVGVAFRPVTKVYYFDPLELTDLQPGDRVVVPRFGYDRPGRVVKIDPRKNIAVVAIGQMKWDVPIAELIPQG